MKKSPALKAFNHPSFEVDSVAGSVRIMPTAFGQTIAMVTEPREIPTQTGFPKSPASGGNQTVHE